MRGRSSVLSQAQREQLKVENFIYHIIRVNEDEPEYLEEVILAGDTQREFFRKIISETGQGTQYDFINRQVSEIIEPCARILESPDANFSECSKRIASQFRSHHTGARTSNGVFIVARVTVPVNAERKSLIALIKLDYSPVMRQRKIDDDPARVSLEEIIEALSEDKNSVQKRALIDIEENGSWDILAVERKKVGSKLDTEDAITDYFRNFLGAKLRENNSSITKRIVTETYQWARGYDAGFEGRTPTDIRHSLIKLMDAYEDRELTFDEVVDQICIHSDATAAERMRESYNVHMDEAGLGGTTFSPKPKSIGGRERKGKWKTDTGVEIIWTGQRNPNNLKKEPLPDGSVIITIIANEVTESD